MLKSLEGNDDSVPKLLSIRARLCSSSGKRFGKATDAGAERPAVEQGGRNSDSSAAPPQTIREMRYSPDCSRIPNQGKTTGRSPDKPSEGSTSALTQQGRPSRDKGAATACFSHWDSRKLPGRSEATDALRLQRSGRSSAAVASLRRLSVCRAPNAGAVLARHLRQPICGVCACQRPAQESDPIGQPCMPWSVGPSRRRNSWPLFPLVPPTLTGFAIRQRGIRRLNSIRRRLSQTANGFIPWRTAPASPEICDSPFNQAYSPECLRPRICRN